MAKSKTPVNMPPKGMPPKGMPPKNMPPKDMPMKPMMKPKNMMMAPPAPKAKPKKKY